MSEEVVEEKHFVVEFSGLFEQQLFDDKLKTAKFINVEGSEVILQIGHQFFTGNFEPSFGTNICFEKAFERDSTTANLVFTAKTDMKIVMQRIFLQPKSETNIQTD